MKRRGFTLMELLVGMGILSMLIFGTMTMYVSGVRQHATTNADILMSQTSADAIRRISESIRPAVSITIADDGQTLQYNLPALASSADPVTGEVEYLEPIVSDGVTRSFTIENGQLIDSETDRVLVENIILTDPDPDSSQYGQEYAPFQLTTIGSRRAITVQLITRKNLGVTHRYSRMKTTIIIRNG